MGDSEPDCSSEPTNIKKNENEPGIALKFEPGPDLKPPGRFQRWFSIIRHVRKFHGIQIFIMIFSLVLLIDLVLRWDVLCPPIKSHNSTYSILDIIQDTGRVLLSPMFFQDGATQSSAIAPNLVDWWIRVQSLLGVGTLIVALFVWYGEIHEDWENRLPKRMSVFFLHKGWPAIVCRYIWLAGEDDLRAWGQQVAAQAACERYLNFSPNLKAQDPTLAVWIDGKICMHCVLCFELTDENPFLSKYSGMCRYQNMATGSNAVSSIRLADLQSEVPPSVFPFDWPEESITPT